MRVEGNQPTAEENDWTSVASNSEPRLAAENPRYHHLDSVRAFALLLGVFFHAAESFGAGNDYWAIVDCSPSEFLQAVRFACHSFRLELFFVIAGFFAGLMLVRRGTAGFVKNRAKRVLVPFVVGWLLLYPLLVFIWLWGASVGGRLRDFGVPPEALNAPLWQLTLGFFLTGGFLQKFDLTHLWFLHQLLVIYALFLGMKWLLGRCDAHLKMPEISGQANNAMAQVDAWFARLFARRAVLFYLLLPTVPMLLLMRGWGVDTPKESLVPQMATTFLFGYFFLLGLLFHRNPGLIDRLAPSWTWHFAVGLTAWIALLLALRYVRMTRIPFTILYALMMWGFVLGFLGFFARFCQRPNAWMRYLADSSYWIYITHLPLVVALQVIVGRLPVPWPVKYPSLCAIAIVILFLSYHYLVRGTFIGVQLNGRRYPLVWPWHHRD